MLRKSIDKDVKLDMTPMIDIVFLLLIFFMCATRFKQVERRLDAFLPEEIGQTDGPLVHSIEPLTIFVRDDAAMRGSHDFNARSMREATYYLSSRDARPVANPAELFGVLKQLAGGADARVLIAPYDEGAGRDQLVPFFNIVRVVDLCKEAGIVRVNFQAPAQMN
ncbi:MAG: biopolymer transporter ExbD [Planctomycetota bacterium]|nr:biopolymer transporter ExbD [Planctomycetota bacterium]